MVSVRISLRTTLRVRFNSKLELTSRRNVALSMLSMPPWIITLRAKISVVDFNIESGCTVTSTENQKLPGNCPWNFSRDRCSTFERNRNCPGVSLRFCIRRGIVATDALEISMYQVGNRQAHGETCRFLDFRILYTSSLRYLPLVVDIMRRKLEEKCLSCDPLRVGQSIILRG